MDHSAICHCPPQQIGGCLPTLEPSESFGSADGPLGPLKSRGFSAAHPGFFQFLLSLGEFRQRLHPNSLIAFPFSLESASGFSQAGGGKSRHPQPSRLGAARTVVPGQRVPLESGDPFRVADELL